MEQAPQWAGLDQPIPETDETGHPAGGLVSVLVAHHREHSDKALVAGFLLDVWCLGVKNALPPEAMSPTALAEHRHAYFQAHESHIQVPADLARALVFGAAAYAHTLGFKPNEDFDDTVPTLGEPDQPSPIRFGRDGMPFYMNGPLTIPWPSYARCAAPSAMAGSITLSCSPSSHAADSAADSDAPASQSGA